MRPLLALLLLLPGALLAQDNPSYDPDYNGDGCYSIADILGLLPLFGSCEPWQCGDSTEFDSYWYETVLMGDQCWFAENLRTTKYANGDSIPANLPDSVWAAQTLSGFGATAVYGEGSTNCENYSPDIDACDEAQSLAEYGRLYNWYAVDDTRGLCPSGWHVPTECEFIQLQDFITSQGFAGAEATALRSTYGWSELHGGGNGTDDFGFSGLPSGDRYRVDGSFTGSGWVLTLWNSTPENFLRSGYQILSFDCPEIFRSYTFRNNGFSVRCLKDAE